MMRGSMLKRSNYVWPRPILNSGLVILGRLVLCLTENQDFRQAKSQIASTAPTTQQIMIHLASAELLARALAAYPSPHIVKPLLAFSLFITSFDTFQPLPGQESPTTTWIPEFEETCSNLGSNNKHVARFGGPRLNSPGGLHEASLARQPLRPKRFIYSYYFP